MSEPLQLIIDRIDTPIGEMLIIADHDGNLRAVDWTDHEARMLDLLRRYYGANGFKLEAGKYPSADAVWRALRDIPCGETVSYGKLALKIGAPRAVRAVGLANGSNPVGVVVPCHRVIGADGSLTGYGGGIDRKRWLLEHEHVPGVATSRRQNAERGC